MGGGIPKPVITITLLVLSIFVVDGFLNIAWMFALYALHMLVGSSGTGPPPYPPAHTPTDTCTPACIRTHGCTHICRARRGRRSPKQANWIGLAASRFSRQCHDVRVGI